MRWIQTGLRRVSKGVVLGIIEVTVPNLREMIT